MLAVAARQHGGPAAYRGTLLFMAFFRGAPQPPGVWHHCRAFEREQLLLFPWSLCRKP